MPVLDLGLAGGDRLVVDGAFDVALEAAAAAWREAIPRLLGREAATVT